MTVSGTAAPARSLAQRMDALQRGNEVRTYRAELKREMRGGGGRKVVDVLAGPAWQEESWKVCDLLLLVPAYGKVKVERLLRREMVSPSKSVAGLSVRQRDQLLMALGARAVRP